MEKRAEPRFAVTVADDDNDNALRSDEAASADEAPADSLKALLARQMIKQQVNSQTAAKPQPQQQAPRSPQFERQTSGGVQGVSTVQLTEISKQQEQQARLVQQQMDAMRNEMLSMRQLLQHQVSGLMWQDLARREPVRALVIENLQQLGLSEQVADQLACFMPEELNSADAWDAALELLAGRLSTTNDDILRRGGLVAASYVMSWTRFGVTRWTRTPVGTGPSVCPKPVGTR